MSNQLKKLYSNLFNGSARLGILLGTLNLPWAKVTPYVSAFSEELNGNQELSIDGSGEAIGLMTRGSGKDFVHRVARYMEQNGIGEVALRRFLVRGRFFDYKNLFFKIEIDSTGPIEFSYYFRRGASLEVAAAWLKDTGVDDDGFALVKGCAEKLEKESLHFLAAAERVNGESYQKLYFSQPEDGRGVERIYEAGQLVGLTDSSWGELKPYIPGFKDKTLFFSLTFHNGLLCPGAKLDIKGVNPQTVMELMKMSGQRQEACDRSNLLLTTFNKKEFDYLGLRLSPKGEFSTRVYVYR